MVYLNVSKVHVPDMTHVLANFFLIPANVRRMLSIVQESAREGKPAFPYRDTERRMGFVTLLGYVYAITP